MHVRLPLAPLVSCLCLRQHNLHGNDITGRKRTRLYESSADCNNEEEPTTNGASRNIPGVRKRCVDFPAFAYDPSTFGVRQLKNKPRIRSKQDVVRLSDSAVEESAKQTRLLKNRSYAKAEPFTQDSLREPPGLRDLAPPTPGFFDRFFISSPANLLSFVVAYFSFPYITKVFDAIFELSERQLTEILSTFSPGISILYGTFVSLTLSILYNRQRTIQDNVAIECSLLTIMMRSLLSLFRKDMCKNIEAGQCIADQIRTLVRSSRGEELLLLMYNDPYARILELIDSYELDGPSGAAAKRGNLIAFCRDTACDLTKYRAKRLSDETLALPPTHFFILNILTTLILFGYAVSVVPTVDPVTGAPPDESSLLFASLATIYILFFNFATDLNNPFKGVYQVRRSCAASHLLEIKWVLANHPILKNEVDFEEVKEEDGAVLMRSPGVGDFWFDKDEIYRQTNSTLDFPDKNGVESVEVEEEW